MLIYLEKSPEDLEARKARQSDPKISLILGQVLMEENEERMREIRDSSKNEGERIKLFKKQEIFFIHRCRKNLLNILDKRI